MGVAVGGGVTEGHLVAAAQTVVFIVAQQRHRHLGVGGHPALHSGLGAVGGAVVHHDALPQPWGDFRVQQLLQHAGHLLFAVVGGDKHQQFFRFHANGSFSWIHDQHFQLRGADRHIVPLGNGQVFLDPAVEFR